MSPFHQPINQRWVSTETRFDRGLGQRNYGFNCDLPSCPVVELLGMEMEMRTSKTSLTSVTENCCCGVDGLKEMDAWMDGWMMELLCLFFYFLLGEAEASAGGRWLCLSVCIGHACMNPGKKKGKE